MITIKKPSIRYEENSAIVEALIHVPPSAAEAWFCFSHECSRNKNWRTEEDYPPSHWKDGTFSLYFAVEEEYGKYLRDDRADAFVAAMLYYALATGNDIVSEAPVSKRILDGINKKFAPGMTKGEERIRPIHVIAEPAGPVQSEGAVGTGMSCGVDSFYTLLTHTDSTNPAFKTDTKKLTHLTYFDNGAIFHTDYPEFEKSNAEHYQKQQVIVSEKLENAREVGRSFGLPVVFIRSNMDRDLYRGGYAFSATYRNAAMALSLPGLFGTYYCSSLGGSHDHVPNLTVQSQYYEPLIADALSSESMDILISDEDNRLDKIRAIADHLVVQQYLDVCYNYCACGECLKCRQTLLFLDLLGKVDHFGQVFDLESYRKIRPELLWRFQLHTALAKNGLDITSGLAEKGGLTRLYT